MQKSRQLAGHRHHCPPHPVEGESGFSIPSGPAAGHFPVVCNIDAAARWMWYTPGPATITDPFEVGLPPHLPNDSNELLIFRLPVEIVTPVTLTTWGSLKMIYR
jgi:hypothetical protein